MLSATLLHSVAPVWWRGEEVVVVKWGGELCLFGGVVVRVSVAEEGGYWFVFVCA